LNIIIVALQKRKRSASEAETMSLYKRIHDGHITSHDKKSKMGRPKKERAVLSHGPQFDQMQNVTMKARQTRRPVKGTTVCSHPFTVNCHLTSGMLNCAFYICLSLHFEAESY
jgi:hypothetical protein